MNINSNNKCSLREYLPLKQGLRHKITSVDKKFTCIALREYLPLKQGLRQQVIVLWIANYCSESIFH